MPFVDKTDEFFKTVEKVDNNYKIKKDRAITQDTQVGEFASKITELLQTGNQKLYNLERYVKQKGIFNDKTEKIEELTYEVKQLITDSTNTLDSLTHYTYSLNIRNPQCRTHIDNIISSLKNKVFDFTKKFKDVLHIRSEVTYYGKRVVALLLATSCHFFPLLATSCHFFPLLATSSHFFPLLPTSSHFFPLLPTSSHFFPLLPTSSHFFPLLPTSCHFFPLFFPHFSTFPPFHFSPT
ncbi:Qa-SNARE protein [Plasmodium yoelii yoelii]|uniref:Qa-SNARE protein n=1 Tax=Plasmodium yoelii yoelii TaxID=73239 RepID=A0AAE9X1R3_PLAYO|nr:Qa-SNARE protein [Plasmodium yoelii yoelii]